jgi:hypothetical protein
MLRTFFHFSRTFGVDVRVPTARSPSCLITHLIPPWWFGWDDGTFDTHFLDLIVGIAVP